MRRKQIPAIPNSFIPSITLLAAGFVLILAGAIMFYYVVAWYLGMSRIFSWGFMSQATWDTLVRHPKLILSLGYFSILLGGYISTCSASRRVDTSMILPSMGLIASILIIALLQYLRFMKPKFAIPGMVSLFILLSDIISTRFRSELVRSISVGTATSLVLGFLAAYLRNPVGLPLILGFMIVPTTSLGGTIARYTRFSESQAHLSAGSERDKEEAKIAQPLVSINLTLACSFAYVYIINTMAIVFFWKSPLGEIYNILPWSVKHLFSLLMGLFPLIMLIISLALLFGKHMRSKKLITLCLWLICIIGTGVQLIEGLSKLPFK